MEQQPTPNDMPSKKSEHEKSVRPSRKRHNQKRAANNPRKNEVETNSETVQDEAGLELHNNPVQDELAVFDETNVAIEAEPQLNEQQEWAVETVRERLADGYLYEADKVSDARKQLSQTRLELAEASVASREASWFKKKNQERAEQLKEAELKYGEAKQAFLAEELDGLDEDDDERRAAYLVELSSHEDGALMATESLHYLQEIEPKNRWQQSKEWYNGLSRNKRLALGLGGGALLGAAATVTGGLAVAGAAVGARAGNAYMNREASRKGNFSKLTNDEKIAAINSEGEASRSHKVKQAQRDKNKAVTLRNKQENSTRRDYNLADNQTFHDSLNATDDNRELIYQTANYQVDRSETTQENYAQMAEAERKDKYKSAAWAVGGAAVGVSIGSVIDGAPDVFDRTKDWLQDKTPDFGGNSPEVDTNGGSTETDSDNLNGGNEIEADSGDSGSTETNLDVVEKDELFDGQAGSTEFSAEGMKDFNNWIDHFNGGEGYTVQSGDSIWSLSEKYLQEKGIANPSVYQIDAVKDDVLVQFQSQGMADSRGWLTAGATISSK